MLVVYEGVCADGEEIAATGQHAEREKPIEVPDDVGHGLCQQVGKWREHTPETDAEREARLKREADAQEIEAAATAAAEKAAADARKKVAAEQKKRDAGSGN